jgi:protein gp37
MHKRLTAMGQTKYSRPFEEVVFHDDTLTLPLRWHGPRRVFVDSMSDLFHEDVTVDEIADVFAVIRACPQHTFQIATKRPKRYRDICLARWDKASETFEELVAEKSDQMAARMGWCHADPAGDAAWPPPNMHLLVSCEDQHWAGIRVPIALQCPAAVRGVSLEPLLGPIDLTNLSVSTPTGIEQWDALESEYDDELGCDGPKLDWVIVGCESGPKRRDCDWRWQASIVDQCRRADVPVFVKQISVDVGIGGGLPYHRKWLTRVSKDPNECGGWPRELRVRMYPGERWAA